MKSIKEIKKLDGVRVLVRLDLNVPVQNGVIVDDFRIRKALPLIQYLIDNGAILILISHIETVDNPTLKPIGLTLSLRG
jgi:phosphoglycerate kinase